MSGAGVAYQRRRPSRGSWYKLGATFTKWIWGAFCCGLPGVPCYFCNCCEKYDEQIADDERPTVHQATATNERVARPHRPHAPRGRKSTPEMLSAVRYALSQLQGEPAPVPMPSNPSMKTHQPG